MPVEVELKFSADGPAVLGRLAVVDRLGPARLGPPRRVDELDRYLDTADGRCAAAVWACRLRTRGDRTIVSLKGPAAADAGDGSAVHRRPELEGPATETLEPAVWPRSAARDFIDELRAGRPLLERLALQQRRTERPVVIHRQTIGTLSLDRVDVRHHGATVETFWVVELELSPNRSDPPLADLSTALAAVDGLSPDPTTKLERALAILDAAAAPS